MKTVLTLSALCVTGLIAGCANAPMTPTAAAPAPAITKPAAVITRTAHGIPHIVAPDLETLAYGVAYAHAQDNFCQSADHLMTVRGERSKHFGAVGTGIMGVRTLPNAVIDGFIAAHMDNTKLGALWAATSAANQTMARGYVAGYNRYLADFAGRLPVACNNMPWVQPMVLSDFWRATEVVQVQAGAGALADAIVGAQPPKPPVQAPKTSSNNTIDLHQARLALEEAGLYNSPLGSNAWAFGKDVTANGRGMLLGNPHFPWVGTSRFYQMHLTVPGVMDVMGASIGWSGLVQIGFNKDVAWSHTVSTGKRFTLHELSLVDGDPTSYLIDGKPEKMTSQVVTFAAKEADGSLKPRQQTVWQSRIGPVLVVPRAGLNWTAKTAYALKDANAGGLRSTDVYVKFAQASSVADLRSALAGLGTSWVNTIAADRHGQAMYADVSVVPDLDTADLQRCAPSKPAAALLGAAGLVVLDGSRADCDWRKDATSPVPGLTPIARMPLVVRNDWVHNSNDSFFYTHPDVKWPAISPLVGDDVVRRARTRSGLIEVPELVSRGKVTLAGIQSQLFDNRNLMARMVLPDLLAACDAAPNADARDGCVALKRMSEQGFRNNLDSRGAVLFREFWRTASAIPGVYRVAFDKARPVDTPMGLKMTDPATATRIWAALSGAVVKVRAAGVALDAPLGQVQQAVFSTDAIGVHGGDEIEGVLNNIGDRASPGIGPKGIRIDYGTSYVQTVTFDERGPVAQALLTYGQSTNPASPHATDQLKLYSRKEWPTLPFHAADVERQRVGEVLRLAR